MKIGEKIHFFKFYVSQTAYQMPEFFKNGLVMWNTTNNDLQLICNQSSNFMGYKMAKIASNWLKKP